ncbi:MAG TPA: T9SS type A sorting domain-containing protein [Ohtaekwangia sp.]
MKRIALIVLISLSVWQQGITQVIVFDDFTYTDANDAAIESFNRWTIVNGVSGPPSGAVYQKSNVTFAEGIMSLRCSNSGTPASATHARLESKDVVYFEGTYAARVMFDDSPYSEQDPVIQTFYAISPSSGGQNPATYSEVDFEYLPWDSWNGLYNNNYNHAMWMSSYESARVLTGGLDNDHEYIKGSLGGVWHTLLFRFTDGTNVEYFIDGVLKATLSVRQSDGVSVYPDYNMLVSFANWGYPPIEGTSFGNSTALRSSTMKVDWFVYVEDQSKSVAEVEDMVSVFRENGIDRQNRVGQKQGPGVITDVENGVDNAITFYPNPVTDRLFIQDRTGNNSDRAVVLDASGKIVLQAQLDRSGINVSSLRAGLYLITIQSDKGTFFRARFIKT